MKTVEAQASEGSNPSPSADVGRGDSSAAIVDETPDAEHELGSRADSAAWWQSHPQDFSCDGAWHTQSFVIDTTEQGFGDLEHGQAWVQFCLTGGEGFPPPLSTSSAIAWAAGLSGPGHRHGRDNMKKRHLLAATAITLAIPLGTAFAAGATPKGKTQAQVVGPVRLNGDGTATVSARYIC